MSQDGDFPFATTRCDAAASALTTCLDRLTPPQRVENALRHAAALVEYAAFEQARMDETTHVTGLILLSAEIERAADRLDV